MKNVRPKADVVTVGLGWCGSLIAEELTRAGLNVVAIERGPWFETATDFPPSIDTDELRWDTRRSMLLPPAVETTTFRNSIQETALPSRDWNLNELGYNVGGSGTHWAGMAWRFTPFDLQPYTQTVERYGKQKIAKGLILQDWGVTYDELEPFYDRFEKIAGVSGKAGKLNGEIIPDGNPYEGNRSSEYPLPPLEGMRLTDLFRDAAKSLGQKPFMVPAGQASRAYVNPLGVRMGPCTYCGYCLYYGCGNFSKSSPNACVIPALMQRENFTVLTDSAVVRVNKAADGKTATGVTYIDRNQQQWEQPADMVILSAFQMQNVRLLLLSKIGQPYDPVSKTGVVGRAYSFQTVSGASLFFEDENLNQFIGAGALSQQVDDFNGDNFDHSELDFIGGAGILVVARGARPIGNADALPPGTPRWGKAWKKAYTHAFQNGTFIFGQGTSFSHEDYYLDLDPEYKDDNGNALLRVTFDYNENDRRSAKFIEEKSVEIGKAMGAKIVIGTNSAAGKYSPYNFASDHTIGGAVMGVDPATSVVNRYQQSWDMHNLFVLGASSFPNNAGYNPTGTIGALSLWTAKAIIEQYVKNPGPLVKV
ncbi:GMC family oxidoreductase [Erwiniaceae bacterium BAC15a-03b]|uniref:GMC family oxidoreductase n=1 Tax=Winslowiella arboricola TaxID=2978220 RepID=A0A9J6PMU8_9GAMM|nr:GMC family oxidoreductase [Winslowiella arboricola]MCU5774083.1 GMC family oxidoreductase [Winslowiella arboricola]MCU5776984.1 GMC family oxidoreductase [Winslowiella arboricola]